MRDVPSRLERFIRDDDDAFRLFDPIRHERVEVAAFAYLTRDGRMLGMRHVRSNRPHLVDVPIRAITIDALSLGASAIVLAHNHPSGDCRPSRGDIAATRMLVRVLGPLGVSVRDHFVLSQADRTSFQQNGLL